MKRIQNRMDFWICRPIVGIPLFFLVIYVVFMLSFSDFGAWITDFLGTFFFLFLENIEIFLLAVRVNPKMVSFLIGIFQDMVSVFAFLPQTAIFFFLLKGLEDCGYLARAVFAMDTFFSRFGLSGNAVIPAVIGCNCSVSAVSASEELHPDEQKILLDSIPFLICNARFPVLFFFAESFFPKHPSLAALFFYMLSVLIFFLSAGCSSKGKIAPPLIVGLPDYKMPKFGVLFHEVKLKSKEYLARLATVIFLCSVIFRLCFLLTPTFSFAERESESLLILFGKAFSFLFKPLGFAQAPFAIALFAGFFAKENLMFVLEMLSPKELFLLLSFPARVAFTSFSMLYLPCFTMLFSIFRKSGMRKTMRVLLRSFLFAYITALILYTLSDFLVNFVGF